MDRQSIVSIVRALDDAEVRYLIAGGLAVVAHGYVRFTADVDLIIDLDERNARRAVTALSRLGYRPRAPVAFELFANAAARAQWVREKGMTVFSLSSDQHPLTEVDLFVEAPLDFAIAHAAAVHQEIAPGIRAPFVGFDDLVALKQAAGRPRDLEDLERLRALREERDDG